MRSSAVALREGGHPWSDARRFDAVVQIPRDQLEDSSSDESASDDPEGEEEEEEAEQESHENNTTVQEMKDGSHITRNDGVQGFTQNSRRDDTSRPFESQARLECHFLDLDEVILIPARLSPLQSIHCCSTPTATGFGLGTCVRGT